VHRWVAFPADAEAAEELKPGKVRLDDPALRAEAGAVFGAAPRDDRLDAAAPELASVLVVVVVSAGK
jgi:hypothetical protein